MNATSGYSHQAGVHCGSTALRNLLAARGLSLSEPLVFGLGAGLGFSLHDGARGLEPPLPARFFVGRSLAFEEELCRSIGARLEVLRFDSPAAAWACARAAIEKNSPLLAFTDLLHLPYLGARGHWFGHLIALAGMSSARDAHGEPESVLVGDNERANLEPVPLASLKLALSAAAVAPQRTRILLAVHDVHPLSPEALRGAIRRALALQAEQMRALALRPFSLWLGEAPLSGIPALRALPDELRSWNGAPDLHRRLRFAAQVIELRGNGGGLFRRLYAAFLSQAAQLGVPEAAPLIPLCLRAADAFTALAIGLEKLRQPASTAAPEDGLHANHPAAAPDLREALSLAEATVSAEAALYAAMP